MMMRSLGTPKGLPTPRAGRGVGAPLMIMAIFVGFTVFNLLLLERYRERNMGGLQRQTGGGSGVLKPPPPHEHKLDPQSPFQPSRKWERGSGWSSWGSMDDIVRASVPQEDWRPTTGQHAEDSRAGAEALHRSTGCDVMTIPFNPTSDEACIRYMTDVTKWNELVPLAMRFDARTIKFQVKFADRNLHSILKVPQRLFPNEAFSEVAAYHADRVLETQRIPPTGWVCIPIKTVNKATEAFGRTVETEQEFLKDSGVQNYSDWIQKDLLDYAKHARLVEQTNTGEDCIGASIQLHVADVHHLLDSPLRIPYKAHNTSWYRFFDLTTEDPTDAIRRIVNKPWVASIVHIAELNAFDYVIGNGDRSPNKNNFIVGKCTKHLEYCDEDTDQFKATWLHLGPPTFVHLDQGMGFYDSPRNNPLGASMRSNNVTFCHFRAPFLNRMQRLADEGRDRGGAGFDTLMAARLPAKVKEFVSKKSLRKCHRRLEEVLGKAEQCLAQPFASFVVTP
jgi:hypothetical protein